MAMFALITCPVALALTRPRSASWFALVQAALAVWAGGAICRLGAGRPGPRWIAITSESFEPVDAGPMIRAPAFGAFAPRAVVRIGLALVAAVPGVALARVRVEPVDAVPVLRAIP